MVVRQNYKAKYQQKPMGFFVWFDIPFAVTDGKVDALKEFAYQKLLQRIADREKQDWGTVQYYAIIDTALKFKENSINPATGYKGDRWIS